MALWDWAWGRWQHQDDSLEQREWAMRSHMSQVHFSLIISLASVMETTSYGCMDHIPQWSDAVYRVLWHMVLCLQIGKTVCGWLQREPIVWVSDRGRAQGSSQQFRSVWDATNGWGSHVLWSKLHNKDNKVLQFRENFAYILACTQSMVFEDTLWV